MEENPWDQIVEAWMAFNNSERNKHRDFLNLPAFVSAMPPPEKNSVGLEIGGGEGTLARKLASLGYFIHSTDISPKMIQEARKIESESKLGLEFSVENAEHLSFRSQSFDFVIAFMCLMDMNHPDKCMHEIFRVLKPRGYFQFSNVHPCFASTSHSKHVKDEAGVKIAREVGKYNEEGLTPVKWNYPPLPEFTTFHHHLTLSHWIMLEIQAGFVLEFISEPYATPEIIKECPHLEHTVTVPDNILMRFRKK